MPDRLGATRRAAASHRRSAPPAHSCHKTARLRYRRSDAFKQQLFLVPRPPVAFTARGSAALWRRDHVSQLQPTVCFHNCRQVGYRRSKPFLRHMLLVPRPAVAFTARFSAALWRRYHMSQSTTESMLSKLSRQVSKLTHHLSGSSRGSSRDSAVDNFDAATRVPRGNGASATEHSRPVLHPLKTT